LNVILVQTDAVLHST